MNTQQVANRLTELCRQGKWEEAISELYADNCVSIEPAGSNMPERVEGLEALQQKGDAWNAMVEQIHGMGMSDPLVAGDQFACRMTLDITMKGMPRMNNEELCLYTVKDGKVVAEQFFYSAEQG